MLFANRERRPATSETPQQVESLVTRTVSDFGRLDIIVNNAGWGTILRTINGN